jgi:hypothetical protein
LVGRSFASRRQTRLQLQAKRVGFATLVSHPTKREAHGVVDSAAEPSAICTAATNFRQLTSAQQQIPQQWYADSTIPKTKLCRNTDNSVSSLSPSLSSPAPTSLASRRSTVVDVPERPTTTLARGSSPRPRTSTMLPNTAWSSASPTAMYVLSSSPATISVRSAFCPVPRVFAMLRTRPKCLEDYVNRGGLMFGLSL